MASVQVIQGPDKGRTFDLIEGENSIGRLGVPVELTENTVSRRHATITPRNGQWILEDLGSANGTYLNGVRLRRPAVLHRGDQIRCGQTLLVFGGQSSTIQSSVDVDESGQLVDAAIVATIPSNEDSVIIPTPEAGREAIDNLRIIYDLISEVSSIFNIDQLLQRTLDKVFEVLRADRGFIMLIDENEELKLKASRVIDECREQKAPISRTIINEVASKQVGILSSNAMSDKRFAAGKSVHDLGIRSAVCVPLKGRERILGVMHVDCSVSDHTYSTEQLRLLTAIGFHTGLAVENVRLYESAVQSERLAAVGETVAFLSHHIKNILQGLSAGIDLVEMGLQKEQLGKAKDAWPIVQRNLGRINDLILNMLAFSKNRQPLLENVNINRVLDDCLELMTPRADERNVAVLSDLDDLPAIPADAAGLSQAFLNLMSNALDAVEDETGVITVRSKYDSMNRQVIVQVIDNGSGIEPDKLDQIFTPFYSAKGHKGTGLGLAVARKVTQEHRGTIDVDSTVGEGTTFTVSLPSMPGDAGETAGPAR
ncbi:MAG: ATP-binding protein [Phycisphaerae bacterium]